jgi:hypothetical protein
MTIRALTRPARAGRMTTRLSQQRTRRALRVPTRDAPRSCARWTLSNQGRPELVWEVPRRARSPIERKRGSHA